MRAPQGNLAVLQREISADAVARFLQAAVEGGEEAGVAPRFALAARFPAHLWEPALAAFGAAGGAGR